VSVKELIAILQNLPATHHDLPVYVHDGMDPSDPCEARGVSIILDEKPSLAAPKRLEIVS
jgi:hypothetical protein